MLHAGDLLVFAAVLEAALLAAEAGRAKASTAPR
jgi:hypothetical protein